MRRPCVQRHPWQSSIIINRYELTMLLNIYNHSPPAVKCYDIRCHDTHYILERNNVHMRGSKHVQTCMTGVRLPPGLPP